MGEISAEERQRRYDVDVAIINKRADGKIEGIKSRHKAFDEKQQADVDKLIASKKALRDKRKAGIKAEWDRRLAGLKAGQEWKKPVIDEEYDGMSDLADLAYEDWFDYAAEVQYKKDGRRKESDRLEIERVEKWRLVEIAKEGAQVGAGTQRQRKQ